IKTMISLTGDSTLAQHAIDMRAFEIGVSADHDNALFLHCTFNNLPTPSEEELRNANLEAMDALNNYEALFFGGLLPKKDPVKIVMAFALFHKQYEQLSPLARLRVDLYRDAATRLVPVVERTASVKAPAP